MYVECWFESFNISALRNALKKIRDVGTFFSKFHFSFATIRRVNGTQKYCLYLLTKVSFK